MRVVYLALLALIITTWSGCIRIKSDPIRVEPIHITMDINLKVQRELDKFFSDLDALAQTMESSPKGENPLKSN